MRLAHLILTHANPAQLERLVDSLQHPDSHFFIHIDLKTDISPFSYLAKKRNVRFITNRVKVYWGGYSIVQATINGLMEIRDCGTTFGYINLLSGQDYPIKPIAYIHKYLDERPGKAFIHSLSVYDEWQEAIGRITKYHFTHFQFPGRYTLQKYVNTIAPTRKFPMGMTPVGRSQWFTIAPEFAAYIINFLEEHRSFRRFFKLSWAPDEMVFQTIIHNSPLAAGIVNDNLLYIDWSEGKASPKVLTIADAEALKSSPKLFARKFNPTVDNSILDYLDRLNGYTP